ncbi:hypothetical protein EV641_104212 [Rhodococcus sp. SMB37]|uniref:hypothetical protein n=1 Tax=Rhodococcus sp. SMB37 TaxID=2512213 RepID=UPI00104FD16D|nr:hypothetical protein [Rhodococcus sp. SMB37]TCN54947.1 hypothetical protein EV641_104212 [Rhodococcus sp. SMB37]
MTTARQVRKAALYLPEVEEGKQSATITFSVRSKLFVSIADGGVVQLRLPENVIVDALERHPSGERLVQRGAAIGIRIPLADINGQELNGLVRQAWISRAPKRLAAALVDADSGRLPTHSDLPISIGKPATQALLGAGVVTLDDVAVRSKAELAALHGVGPKALRILEEAVRESSRIQTSEERQR